MALPGEEAMTDRQPHTGMHSAAQIQREGLRFGGQVCMRPVV